MNIECWDCSYFKAHGLCCPKHGTPEEKEAAHRETNRRLVEVEKRIAETKAGRK